MTDLGDYLEAYGALRDKSPQELVDLALEHLVNVSPLENLLVQELCSRVDPGWEKRNPLEKRADEKEDRPFTPEEAKAYGDFVDGHFEKPVETNDVLKRISDARLDWSMTCKCSCMECGEFDKMLVEILRPALTKTGPAMACDCAASRVLHEKTCASLTKEGEQ